MGALASAEFGTWLWQDLLKLVAVGHMDQLLTVAAMTFFGVMVDLEADFLIRVSPCSTEEERCS